MDSINNYKKLGISLEVLDDDTVKVSQTKLINSYIPNQKQLIERGKEVYPNKKIIPVVFSLDVEDATLEWIGSKMVGFGIKRNGLIKQLAVPL